MSTKQHLPLALIIVSLTAAAASAVPIFTESFEDDSATIWGNWSHSNTSNVIVAEDGVTHPTHGLMKADDGSQSIFMRDGTRNIALKSGSAIDVVGYSEVTISFSAAQNDVANNYESGDFIMLSIQFDDGQGMVEVLKDSGKADGGGSMGSPLSFSGVRLDLANATGEESAFVDYYVTVPVPVAASTLQLRFSMSGSSNNEDYWVDNVAVDAIPEPATLALLGVAGLVVCRRR